MRHDVFHRVHLHQTKTVLEMYEVHNPVPLIVGSSVGGLLLLALITGALYKVRDLSFLRQDSIMLLLQGKQELMLESEHILTGTHHEKNPPHPVIPRLCLPVREVTLVSLLFFPTLLCFSLCFPFQKNRTEAQTRTRTLTLATSPRAGLGLGLFQCKGD